MTTPPGYTPGQYPQDDWYRSSGSEGVPPAPSNPTPQGSPYGPPVGQPPMGPPYGIPSNGPYSHSSKEPQTSGSGSGVVKWLVIGCLGCSSIAVLGFVALLIIGMIGGSDPDPQGSSRSTPVGTSSTTGSGASDSGGDESTASETATQDPITDEAAGSSDESDAAKLTVTSTERTNELRDSIFEYSTENEYFVVEIEYTNTSEEAQSLWASDFILVDESGKEYTTNTDVSLALENPIIIEEVNPGLTIQGTLIFEVPPGTEFSSMRLDESFGTSEALKVEFQ